MALQVGIDLGSRALKVIAGRAKGPIFELHRAFTVPVAMDGEVEAGILDALGALKAELGKAPGARFGVSGKELIIRYTKVPPVPLWRLKLLMDFEVREMAEQAGDELACDYNIVTVPGSEADDETVLVAVVKEPFLAARHLAITESCGEPKAAMPNSLALFNAWLQAGALHEEQYVFLVDLGDRNVEIVLEKDGELLFARNIAAGGRLLTESVGQTFGVDLEHAEQIKEDFGNVTPKGLASYTSGKEEKVANALIGPVGQLSSMIQSSLAFARSQTGLPNLQVGRILVSGGGANLRGLPEYLQSMFHCPVERFQPEGGLDLSNLPAAELGEFNKDPGRFASALGLAVSGSKEDAFIVDLVPAPVKKKRHFQTRTVFSWAAAAVAVVFLVLHYMDLSKQEDVSRKKARVARSKASAAVRDRKDYESIQYEINRQNEQLVALDALSKRSWAVARAIRLIQQHVPGDTWIEDIQLVDRVESVPLPNGKKGKRSRLVVDVVGVMLSVKSQGVQSLTDMCQAIEKTNPGVSAQVVAQGKTEGAGAKQLRFTVEIDPFSGEREAEAKAAAKSAEDEAGN
ncbi:MAG: hypothetical protein CMJ83_13425 [Planctomycetes bacterium]|nr:hypothetical protein [Planctomycetota bacterium]